MIWNRCPVPSHKELVVRCEDASVKYFKRSFQQWWPRPLQHHLALLRKLSGEFTFSRSARKIQLDEIVRPRRCRGERCPRDACTLQETPPVDRADALRGT